VKVTVEDQFGEENLIVQTSRSLCVPSFELRS